MQIRLRGGAWRAHDRFEHLTSWHRWFAWRPVRLGEFEVRWLEMVERKGSFHAGADWTWWEWEYRFAPQPIPDKRGEGGQ